MIYTLTGEPAVTGMGIAGAAGDGVTDDTEALTAALNQSNTIVDGGNKKYKYMSITMTNVENLTVKNVIFWRGQKMDVAGCKNIRFENCIWEGINNNGDETIWTYGIRLQERKDENGEEIWCEDIWIEDCIFRDIWYNPYLNNGHGNEISGEGILPRSVHKLFIKHNLFTQVQSSCIHWNTYKKCGYAEITDNTFYLNGMGGVCIYAVQQQFPRIKGKVCNNQFIGCGLGKMPDYFFESYPPEQQGLGCAALLGGAGTSACPYKWQFLVENNVFEDNVESSIEGPTWNPCIGNSITGQGAIQTEENCRLMEQKYHLDYKLHVRVINSVNFIYRNYYQNADGSYPNDDNDPIVYQNNTMGIAHVARDGYIHLQGDYNVPVIFTGNVFRTGLSRGLDTHLLFCNFNAGIRFENNDGIYPYFNNCTVKGDFVLDEILSQWKSNFEEANLITNQSRDRFPETRFSFFDPSRASLDNDQAVLEDGYAVLSAKDMEVDTGETEPDVPIYDLTTDSHYDAAEEAVVFDGTFGIDTGIKLFENTNDFTIIVKFRVDSYHDDNMPNFSFIPVISAMKYAEDRRNCPGFDIGLSLEQGMDDDAIATGGFINIRNCWKISMCAAIDTNSYFGYSDKDYGVLIIRKNGVLSFYDFFMQSYVKIDGALANTIFDGTLHLGENMTTPTIGGDHRLKGRIYDCRVYDKALRSKVLEEMFPNIYSNESRTKGTITCYVPNRLYAYRIIRCAYVEVDLDLGEFAWAKYAGMCPQAVGIKVYDIYGWSDVIWVGTGTNGHVKQWISQTSNLKPHHGVTVAIANTGLCPGLKAKLLSFRCVLLTEDLPCIEATDFNVEWDKDCTTTVGQTLKGNVTFVPEDANVRKDFAATVNGESVALSVSGTALLVNGIKPGVSELTVTLMGGAEKTYKITVTGG